MRAILASLLFASLALAKPDGYPTKYDNINITHFLRKTYNHFFFFLDIIPDALQTECSKCNEKQKAGVEKAMKYLIEEKRDVFDRLSAKYDPKGIYLKKYKQEAEKRGIKL
ncbi:ejaculatory bulb-specific protein 3 [Halyomorpha halys]|uniref:ejaculatory bulb-specific protein 3 n=1 Tax=Halyomorpha halys TaxID=286706 RepID=UPI0006D4F7FF